MSELIRERRVLKPVQLNVLARDLLESSFSQVWVEGEISNFSRPASGHLYFTLKDERAQVRCASSDTSSPGRAYHSARS